jgi:hypothetical protein
MTMRIITAKNTHCYWISFSVPNSVLFAVAGRGVPAAANGGQLLQLLLWVQWPREDTSAHAHARACTPLFCFVVLLPVLLWRTIHVWAVDSTCPCYKRVPLLHHFVHFLGYLYYLMLASKITYI